ncbi:MAG: response regulator [Steroidobacteraceae bacterium]|nr:response regulator [Steroidobacteraceae bacterium]
MRKRGGATFRERERLKDEFIATLAHELRNPLAPIRSAVEVLSLGAADPQTVSRACDVIRRQLRILTRLVDDLLDISRIVRGDVELRREPLDLRSVIGTAIETARPVIEQSRHTLEVHVRNRPLPVIGDASRLAQAIVNLLNNAAKYTNPGGRIVITAACVREFVALRVRDTGIGISTDQLPRIFELFAQAEPASRRSMGGLGVGLALARQLAERHGGALTAYSAGPGRGSAFTLVLPRASARAPVESETPQSKHWDSGLHRRVLIVEDDMDTAESMAALLRMWGHEVAIAGDGSMAVAKAVALRPDVLLVDIGLPTFDGYHLAEALKAMPETAGIPLIAVSAHARTEDRERSARAGFRKHLVKPVDPELLRGALE